MFAVFGFVILSHRAPAQLSRLVGALNALYDRPPVAIHHDFGQSALDVGGFPSNVRFVHPHHKTAWGKWSLVKATLSGLRTLYGFSDPDYFALLSGADYPIRHADQALADMRALGADAFIDAFSLDRALAGDIEIGQPNLAHHRAWGNVLLARNRYLRNQIKFPVVRTFSAGGAGKARFALGRYTYPLPFKAVLGPYSEAYRCYVGSQWFTATREIAQTILNPSASDKALQRWLSTRIVPDESYFQTVICNRSDLPRVGRTFRFAEWNGGGAHPTNLGMADFDDMLGSGDHFARKFEEDDPVLDAIDDHLGLRRGV